MGMYTEIIFGAGIREDTPEEIIQIIFDMANDKNLPKVLPDHPFFKSERTWFMISGGSYYFPGTVAPKFWLDGISKQWYLHFRTNLKNYGGEIEEFLDWIKPYISKGSGERGMYAIVMYEEASEPTIYYLD